MIVIDILVLLELCFLVMEVPLRYQLTSELWYVCVDPASHQQLSWAQVALGEWSCKVTKECHVRISRLLQHLLDGLHSSLRKSIALWVAWAAGNV